MLVLVRVIGIVIAVMGIIFLLAPKKIKGFLAFLENGKRVYIIGVLRLLIAVVFLLAATQCRLVEVMVTLGILILLGGILIFALGLEKIKSILSWWHKRPLLVLRLLGIIILALGGLIIYSA